MLKEKNVTQHQKLEGIVIGEPNTYPQNRKLYQTTNEMSQECFKQLDKIKLEPFKKGKSSEFYNCKSMIMKKICFNQRTILSKGQSTQEACEKKRANLHNSLTRNKKCFQRDDHTT